MILATREPIIMEWHQIDSINNVQREKGLGRDICSVLCFKFAQS